MGLFDFLKKKPSGKTEDTFSVNNEEQEPAPQEQAIVEPPKKTNSVRRTGALLTQYNNGLFKAYDYESVKVAGVEYASPDLSAVEPANVVDLVPEPENQVDSSAIRVELNGVKLGYVPKGTVKDMIADFSKRGEFFAGMTKLVDEEAGKIEIEIAFYKDFSWLEKSKSCIKTKLTKTNKKDMCDTPRYENLEMMKSGDLVTLEYSYESETYIVSDDVGNELGEVSKAISDKISASVKSEKEIIAIIDEILDTDSGKLSASLSIYVNK